MEASAAAAAAAANLIQLAPGAVIEETIPAFYAGKNVFITGGSGFMGKALIEKLLRACPDIGNIYLLLRPKRGQDKDERLQAITDNILFDTLREKDKSALDKLRAVEGDFKEVGLGLSKEDQKEIINNATIVINVAASVRFDDSLRDSILINTRGTREVCRLVLKLKQVHAFLHVSTAYCQHDKKVIEETLYAPHGNWRQAIKIAEEMDEMTLKAISFKYAEGFPNTYTFTKSLAETVVRDLCEGKVPTIVYRPTIVISSIAEPMPGWNDNNNGPVGLIAASSKGLIRSTYVNYNNKLDFVPVDLCINGIIKVIWIQQYLVQDEIAVYNASNNNIHEVTPELIKQIGYDVVRKVTPRVFWYPNFFTTDRKWLHLIHVYLFHFLPAILVDAVMGLVNKPVGLLKIQRKIYAALSTLEYFILNEWKIPNDKYMDIDEYLLPEDKESFYYDFYSVDVFDFFITSARAGFSLILKEDLRNHTENFKIMTRMGYIDKILKAIAIGLMLVYTFNYVLVPSIDNIYDYVLKL